MHYNDSLPLVSQELAGIPKQEFSSDDILFIESDNDDESRLTMEERNILSEYIVQHFNCHMLCGSLT